MSLKRPMATFMGSAVLFVPVLVEAGTGLPISIKPMSVPQAQSRSAAIRIPWIRNDSRVKGIHRKVPGF